jgi:hypothetical protein
VGSQPSRCTLAVQIARLLPSRGMRNKRNPRSYRLEHPTAAQHGIFDKYLSNYKLLHLYTPFTTIPSTKLLESIWRSICHVHVATNQKQDTSWRNSCTLPSASISPPPFFSPLWRAQVSLNFFFELQMLVGEF